MRTHSRPRLPGQGGPSATASHVRASTSKLSVQSQRNSRRACVHEPGAGGAADRMRKSLSPLVFRVHRWRASLLTCPQRPRVRHFTKHSPSSQRPSAASRVPLRFYASRALLYLVIVLCSAARLMAQGATGAAVLGTVAGSGGTPVEDATVLITNTATGERWRTLTHADG